MKGSGTQTDPYICSDFEELMSVATAATVYIEMDSEASDKIINFDDISPEGLTTTLNIGGNINFNNWTIRNFKSYAQNAITLSGSSVLKNLIFENIVYDGEASSSPKAFLNSGNGKMTLQNVKIQGEISSNSATSARHLSVLYGSSASVFDRCVLNLSVDADFSLAATNGYFTDCNFDIDVIREGSIFYFINSTANTPIVMRGCYCTGEIKASVFGETVSTAKSAYPAYNIYNFRTDADFIHIGTGVCVFNKTKCPNITETSSLIGCTDEQLKSAEYLQSVRFPCVEVSG